MSLKQKQLLRYLGGLRSSPPWLGRELKAAIKRLQARGLVDDNRKLTRDGKLIADICFEVG